MSTATPYEPRSTVTPLEALRRLVAACKLIDFADCKDETVWQALAAAQGTAEGVLRDAQTSDIIILQRLLDAAADPMWEGHSEVSKSLLYLAAQNMENARDRIVELEADAVLRDGVDQKPVGHVNHYSGGSVGVTGMAMLNLPNGTPLYAAPVATPPAVVAVPEGWQLVPCEPDEMMQIRGDEATSGYVNWEIDGPSDGSLCAEMVDGIYKAMLRAATQPAAAPSGDEAEQLRGEGWLRAMHDVSAFLPNSYYMDPPDGGSVTVLEQVERMAKDADRYRWLRNEAWGGGMMRQKFPHVVEFGSGMRPYGTTELAEDALDTAIDAAITVTKE